MFKGHSCFTGQEDRQKNLKRTSENLQGGMLEEEKMIMYGKDSQK